MRVMLDLISHLGTSVVASANWIVWRHNSPEMLCGRSLPGVIALRPVFSSFFGSSLVIFNIFARFWFFFVQRSHHVSCLHQKVQPFLTTSKPENCKILKSLISGLNEEQRAHLLQKDKKMIAYMGISKTLKNSLI